MSIDHWQTRLGKAQINLLQNGNAAEWDSSLLFYVLLHSGLCLFANKLQSTQCILTAGSGIVSASVPSINFQAVLENGHRVIFDLGRDHFQTDVVQVQKNCFRIKHTFMPKHGIDQSPMTVDMYICQREWLCIKELAELQSVNYAHCKEAQVDAANLHSVVKQTEKMYIELKVSRKHITAMKAIEKGLLTL